MQEQNIPVRIYYDGYPQNSQRADVSEVVFNSKRGTMLNVIKANSQEGSNLWDITGVAVTNQRAPDSFPDFNVKEENILRVRNDIHSNSGVSVAYNIGANKKGNEILTFTSSLKGRSFLSVSRFFSTHSSVSKSGYTLATAPLPMLQDMDKKLQKIADAQQEKK
jgi:hypothetical protein